jgi:hypothetical protein
MKNRIPDKDILGQGGRQGGIWKKVGENIMVNLQF